jgi:hypothetical protein
VSATPPVVAAKVRVPPAAAVRRERIDAILGRIWDHGLGVVAAPAGSGKTTALASFAASLDVPVAWYRAETWDADEAVMLRHLEAALTAALDGLPTGWASVADAAAVLDSWEGGRALLVIDDLHGLEGTSAEQALGRLIDYAPSWLAVLLASRTTPGFNLSRRQVAGDLLEVGPDDLRFRAWEVERLFRDHYGQAVPPDDLAVLARRTEGWAAGLQLFHLATRNKSDAERRRILSAAGSGTRLMREYLTWNVMADLPEDLRDFMIDTCVLGRLTGSLCDRLLERRGSAALLEELVRRQIFTIEIDATDGSFRYHEVLRSHLDRVLVERIGTEEARARYCRAGELLEEVGATAEALGAYSRAEDWDDVRRLLGGHGERLASGSSEWLTILPPAIIRHEPWLELAAARRARAEGRWTDAFGAYERAEAGFGASSFANLCHEERQALRVWFDPVASARTTTRWWEMLRAGLLRDPLRVARDAGRQDVVPPSFVRGLLALAAGDLVAARRDLREARMALEDGSVLSAIAILGLGVAKLLGGDRAGVAELDRAEDIAERSGATWLARLARSASRLGSTSARVLELDDPDGAARDPWGAALRALLIAWEPGVDDPDRGSREERRAVAAERAAIGFRQLDAAVLESWARGLEALAQAEAGAQDARQLAASAEAMSRTVGVPAAGLFAHRALEHADPEHADDHAQLVAVAREELGLSDPSPGAHPDARPGSVVVRPAVGGDRSGPSDGRTGTDDPRSDGLALRLFGGFALRQGGRPLSLDPIRPRPRARLRLLAAYA